jgi:SAM-dependent methyltransferase
MNVHATEARHQFDPGLKARECRLCGVPLRHTFVDLGMSPPCESFVSADRIECMEAYYPLHVMVCEACFLVQLPEHVSPQEIFSEYAYFSSYSSSWVAHAAAYCNAVTSRFGFGPHSLVVELASNDGYLLQHFLALGVPVLGVEPAANVADVAIAKGVPTRVEFFGVALARTLVAEDRQADLIVGNNVLAQVPDLNDFVGGMKLLLKPHGVITLEFPHIERLIAESQFDTIYHEHFSYLSLLTVGRMLEAHGLRVFDVEELPTHGGSLRVYAAHQKSSHAKTPAVDALIAREKEFGLADLKRYSAFQEEVKALKRDLLEFLIQAKREGKRVAGYGAPAKGNTLMNYCGIRQDFIDFTVDRSPYKQGKYLPGTRIPIHPPDRLREARPDYVLILPWNLKDEIVQQISYVREWGGKLVVPIPEARIVE